MKVPFYPLEKMLKGRKDLLVDACRKVLDSGQYILGDEVRAFETEFAEFQQSRFSCGVSSGHDAIVLILRAMNIGIGDEVLVSGHTFASSWLAITEVGAIPVPIDAELPSRNIDVSLVGNSITSNAKAILVAHMYGRPADMDGLQSLSCASGLALIEDCAQAHGATYKGKAVGNFGVASAFSFYPGKNLGAIGDGGAVCTNNEDLACKLRALRNYGAEIKYHHKVLGSNCRLDELQAAFLRIRLKDLKKENMQRAEIAARYLELLEDSEISLPAHDDSCYRSAWHLFSILVSKRDVIREKMVAKGVETGIHYPLALNKQPCFSRFQFGDLPIAEMISENCLSLPIWPGMPEDEICFVAETLLGSLAQ